MVESDIILLFIRSRVWRIIYAVGPKWWLCRPSEAISLWQQGKVLDIAIDEVSRALSMHVAPPAIW
jgi:hypothetical protein